MQILHYSEAVVEVEQGDFTELHKLRLEKWTPQQATQVSNMVGLIYFICNICVHNTNTHSHTHTQTSP